MKQMRALRDAVITIGISLAIFILTIGCLILVTVAGVQHFGWLTGCAIGAAVYLLMPYRSSR